MIRHSRFAFSALFAAALVTTGCDSSQNLPCAGRCSYDPPACVEEFVAVDLDSDQSTDRCEPTSCETFAPVHCGSSDPIDLDGDGCARECPAAGTSCGGFPGAACAAGEYCDYALEDQCGAADASGFCRTAPEVCTEQYQPVCGCNGITYGNECAAHAAGTSLLHWGRCDDPAECPAIGFVCDDGEIPVDTSGDGCADVCAPYCGGFAGFTCKGANEVCLFPTSTQCGSGDQFGYCAVPPDACDALYDPVCGCDGTTYGNDCEAAASGASIAHDGPCGK